MKERLTNNLGLKVLAIFLAFFLWLIVSNVSNPMKQDYREVAVNIINEEVLKNSNLTYEVNGKSSVTVYYEVHTLDAYKISSSDFYAYVDLSELYDVTGSIPIKIDVVNNKALISGSLTTKPGVIQIKTEEIQEKPFELFVHDTAGEPASGYVIGEINLSPRVVYATGAVSAIGQINSIGVDLAIDPEATGDYTAMTAPVFYDANGNSLNMGGDVTLNTTEITYRVTVLKVKDLALDFQVRGNTANGYRFTGVESDVKSVSVEGMKSALASLSTVVIPAEYLNLEGATKDVVVQVNVGELLPEEVTIAGSDEVIATVTLKVEPLEIRGFKIDLKDAEMTGASDELKYEFDVSTVQVDIEGLTEDLDALGDANLHPVIDVAGMAEGIHKGTLALTPGPGFEVINAEGFEISVTAKDPANSSTSPDDVTGDSETAAGGAGNASKESAKGTGKASS